MEAGSMSAETVAPPAAVDQGAAWDAWLDCKSYRDIAENIGVEHPTVMDWCGKFAQNCENLPPESRQHFDVWNFHKATGDSSYFGKMARR